MATTTGRPLRALIVLVVLIAGLITLMAVSNTWTPKLGLDLRGGTTITLTAKNTTGTGSVDPASLQLAKTIIQSRVDSLGVGETEVTTAGDKQIIVTAPNVQRDELVRLVGQTALLRFRAVYQAEAVTPPATADPSAPASAEPSSDPSANPPTPEPSSAPSPSTTNKRPMPGLPTAPAAPVVKCTEEAPGVAPDKAIDWQPTENCTAQFAEFTCDTQQGDEIADQPLFACDQGGAEKYLLGPTLIEGNQLTGATAGVPQNGIQWVVNLDFNAAGGAAFETATRALAQRTDPGNRFAIVLDGQSISAPSVSAAIPGGRAEISGSFNQKSRDRAGQRLEVRRAAARLRRLRGQQRVRDLGR